MTGPNINLDQTLYAGSEPQGEILTPGSMFAGRYEIVGTVGSGGMGTVYAVKDANRGGKQIALKILHPALFTDANATDVLRKELSAAEEINSEHVIRIYDIGDYKGQYYLSMELLQGETLRTYSNRKQPDPVPVDVAVAVGLQILDGLGKAHAQGVIHRDLKPANIFLKGDPDTGTFTAVILDFGIAKAIGSEAHRTTSSGAGTSIGTWGYMAQEQRNGSTKVGPEADIYSVARILVDMLMGGLPLNEQQSIAVANPAIPKALDDVIFKAQSHLPQMRYSSVDAFVTALKDAVVSTAPKMAGPPPPVKPQMAPPAPSPQLVRPAPTPRKSAPPPHPAGKKAGWSNQTIIMCAAAGVGVLVVLGGISALMRDGGQDPGRQVAQVQPAPFQPAPTPFKPPLANPSLPARPANLLNPALATNYADERADFGTPPQVYLQAFSRNNNDPTWNTPLVVPGAMTITTGELSAAIDHDVQLALINVTGDRGLPDELSEPQFIYEGTFFDQTQNFVDSEMRRITGGNYNYPVVIYCHNARCGMSYNAVLRVVHAGYRNVYWYRGGIASWNSPSN